MIYSAYTRTTLRWNQNAEIISQWQCVISGVQKKFDCFFWIIHQLSSSYCHTIRDKDFHLKARHFVSLIHQRPGEFNSLCQTLVSNQCHHVPPREYHYVDVKDQPWPENLFINWNVTWIRTVEVTNDYNECIMWNQGSWETQIPPSTSIPTPHPRSIPNLWVSKSHQRITPILVFQF